MGDAAATSHEGSAKSLPLPPEGSKVVLCDDGRYHWRGSVDLWHNPTVFFLILKALGIILGTLGAILLIVVSSVRPSPRGVAAGSIVGLIVCVGVILVALIAYAIYAAVLDGWYNVDFQMDETGLLSMPAPRETQAARGAAVFAAVAGAISGNYGVTAASIASMASDSASVFASVHKVRGIRKHGCIKVSQPFLFNQVYVAPEDYDFVFAFIADHCPKAKVLES